jgi:microcystin-dependent protein
MSQPYYGEIRMFAGNFAPAGWMLCEGQILPISGNETLFQLIGTTYGGDGENTFGLPDLRGRVPIHQGNGFVIGEQGGVEEVTLTVPQIPAHSHALLASGDLGNQLATTGNLISNSQGAIPYLEDVTTLNMRSTAITPVGGSQPHTNFQPYLCINFIISLFGVFPSQT